MHFWILSGSQTVLDCPGSSDQSWDEIRWAQSLCLCRGSVRLQRRPPATQSFPVWRRSDRNWSAGRGTPPPTHPTILTFNSPEHLLWLRAETNPLNSKCSVTDTAGKDSDLSAVASMESHAWFSEATHPSFKYNFEVNFYPNQNVIMSLLAVKLN